MSFRWSCEFPYKLKLDILLRLFEKVELLSSFFYMTEGTEESRHTAAKDYNTKTMRDGGNDAWNMSSSYLDIKVHIHIKVGDTWILPENVWQNKDVSWNLPWTYSRTRTWLSYNWKHV